jgi:NAD-dependent deacetylase
MTRDLTPPNGAGASGATTASPHPQPVAALVALAATARRIVAFTGAGISTESGIPDYRGPNGVWATGQIPTIADFLDNPATRRRYWERRRTDYPQLVARTPNDGHLALVALERADRLAAVVTQNIDGLHQKAGNAPERVIELHGSAHRVKCLACARSWPADEIQRRLRPDESEPRCEVCAGPLRGATVLFGESLPPAALNRAAEESAACDLMLVVGSSLVVNPAAQLPLLAKRRGARLAIVNRTPTPHDAAADLTLAGDAGPTLRALVTALVGWPFRSAED